MNYRNTKVAQHQMGLRPLTVERYDQFKLMTDILPLTAAHCVVIHIKHTADKTAAARIRIDNRYLQRSRPLYEKYIQFQKWETHGDSRTRQIPTNVTSKKRQRLAIKSRALSEVS